MADSVPFHVYQKEKIKAHVDPINEAVTASGWNGRLTRIGLRGIKKLSGSGLGNFAISVLGLKKLVRKKSGEKISAQNDTIQVAILQDALQREHQRRFQIPHVEGSVLPDDLSALRKKRDKVALAKISKNTPLAEPAPLPSTEQPGNTFQAIDRAEEETYFEKQSTETFTYKPLSQNEFFFLDEKSKPQTLPMDGASSGQTDFPSFLTLDDYEQKLLAYRNLSEEEQQQAIKNLEQARIMSEEGFDQAEIDAAIFSYQHNEDLLSDLKLAKNDDLLNLSPKEIEAKIKNRDVYDYFKQSYQHASVYQSFYDVDKVRVFSLAPYHYLEQKEMMQSLKKEWTFDELHTYLHSYTVKTDEEFSASLAHDTLLNDKDKQFLNPTEQQEIGAHLDALRAILQSSDNIHYTMAQAKAFHEGALKEQELDQPVLSKYFLNALTENKSLTPEDVATCFNEQQKEHLENITPIWSFEQLHMLAKSSEDEANARLNNMSNAIKGVSFFLAPPHREKADDYQKEVHSLGKFISIFHRPIQEIATVDPKDLLVPSSGEPDINKITFLASETAYPQTASLLLIARIKPETTYRLSDLCESFEKDCAQNADLKVENTIAVEQPLAKNSAPHTAVPEEENVTPQEIPSAASMTMALTVIPKTNFLWLTNIQAQKEQHRAQVRQKRAEYNEQIAAVKAARAEQARLDEEKKKQSNELAQEVAHQITDNASLLEARAVQQKEQQQPAQNSHYDELDEDDINNPELQTGVIIEQQKAVPQKTEDAFAQNTDAFGTYYHYQSSTMTQGFSVKYTKK